MMFEILSVVVLALASVNAEFKADCTNPCYCMANGLSWEGKLKYPFIFSSEDNDGKKYTYTFSPCGAKIDCGNTNKSVVLCQMDPTDTTESAYVVIGASGSGNVAWKFANESDTSHYTVTYGGGDNTFDTPPKPRKGVISVTLTTQFGPSFVFSGENSMPEELDYCWKYYYFYSNPCRGGWSRFKPRLNICYANSVGLEFAFNLLQPAESAL
ncbi:uncharacterized protein LOC135339861 isoform X2 [Halichondria panicea]|uniref:uncharacterized protein LOC135339861 isoform X2 n=1 Tax=Halichondria panicea TaxID=6063 RepID=UPI00312B97B5